MNNDEVAQLCAAQGLTRTPPTENLIDRLARIVPPSFEYAFAAITDEPTPRLIEKNSLRFLSAASLAKLFIAAEALRRISAGELQLDTAVSIEQHNKVADPNGLAAHSHTDTLNDASTATVELLLRQMLNVSSNTAANVLIDLLGRDKINAAVVTPSGWSGSEVTRKYLPRDLEPAEFSAAPATMTCPLHLTELLYRAVHGQLVDPAADQLLMSFLFNSIRHGELTIGCDAIPGARYFHKIGELQSADRHGRLIRWQHDAGVLQHDDTTIVLSIMTCYRPPSAPVYFPLADVQRAIFEELLPPG